MSLTRPNSLLSSFHSFLHVSRDQSRSWSVKLDILWLLIIFFPPSPLPTITLNHEKGKRITKGLIALWSYFIYSIPFRRKKSHSSSPSHSLHLFLLSHFWFHSEKQVNLSAENAVFVTMESVATREEGSKTRNNIGKRQIESPLATLLEVRVRIPLPAKSEKSERKKKTMKQKVTEKNHLLNCGSFEASIDFTSTIVPTTFQTSYDRHDYPALWIHSN